MFNYNHNTYFEPEEDAELKAFDIQKCFTSCLTVKNQYPFCLFTMLDEITDFSGTIRDGIYYIKSNNYFPLNGNSWVFRQRLEYAISLGIELEIVYELIPSCTIPADYFNELKDLVFDNCQNGKNIFNSLIGCFNRRTIKNSAMAKLLDMIPKLLKVSLKQYF